MANHVLGICTECNKTNGEEFCLECEVILCLKCKSSHLKRKSNKKHHVDKSYSKILDKRPSCLIHSKEVVFYCSSCCLLICPSCMLEKHKQHDVDEIENAVSKKKEGISSEIVDLESRSENVKQIVDDLNVFEEAYKIDNAILKKVIKVRSDTLKALIDKHTETLIQRVTLEESSQMTRKSEEVYKLEDIKLLCDLQIERLKGSLENTKDIDILLSYGEWEEDVQHVKTREISEFKPIPPIRFIEPGKDEETINELFGAVEIGFFKLQEGDHVRIKLSVTEPINGWGDVTHDSIGTVRGVNDDIVTVDFKEFSGWEALVSEVELVKSGNEEQ
ncbi:E3 ubiquitin-protein ligase TRIM45-like [Mytilus galloprovincialis]|uniref:E3 ubiquitin-protein ligase TRIM45-like n=1 Tax=Mytilus galloprovincialis TaxID=29158 RepID=UPI003F7CA611